MATTISIWVMKFFTEIENALTDAKAKKPIAIGWMYLKRLFVRSCFILVNKKEKAPINIQAGKIQISSVSIAKETPPRL